MEQVTDLQILNGDLAFGPDEEPLTLTGSVGIGQDIKHRILASGLAPLLVTDDDLAGGVRLELLQVVEEDRRIRPGSAGLVGPDAAGLLVINARLMDETIINTGV